MNLQRVAPLLLVSVSILACGGGGGGSSSSGSKAKPPSGLGFSVSEAVYLLGVSIEPLVPTVKGKVATWSVAPALPAGLALHAKTGVLSGTPAETSIDTEYTVTASNGKGDATTTIRIMTAAPARWAYAPNIADDTVSAYAVEAATGRLFFRGYYADKSAEPGPEEALVHPTLPFLYVPNLRNASQNSDVSTFPIDLATGALNEPLAPTPVGIGPHSLRFSVDGEVAYVTNNGNDEVRTFAINQVTGALSPLSTIVTGDGPWNIAVDPLGRYAFVANRLDESISVFDVDPASGDLLGPGEVFDLNGASPSALLVDPTGHHVLVATEGFQFLLSLAIDPPSGGRLKTINATASTATPAGIALHPSGEVVYVASRDDDGFVAYPIDPATGFLSAAGPLVAAGDQPSGLTVDDAGFSLFVPCRKSNEIFVYDLSDPFAPVQSDRVRGRQSPRTVGLSAGTEPVEPRAEGLYVLGSGDDTVAAFAVDPQSGALTAAGTTTLPSADASVLAVDPAGRFVWAAMRSSDTLQTYQIDPVTQGLTPLGSPLSVAPDPAGIGVGPGGNYLYVTSNATDIVQSYRVHPHDGSLRLVQTQGTGASPGAAVVDPTGQFLYVANEADSDVSAFQIGLGTFLGTSQSGPVPPGSTPSAMTFSQAGDQLYVAIADADLVLALHIDPADGGLSLNPPGAPGDSPTGLAVHPVLDRAYVALHDPSGVGGVGVYSLAPVTGKPSYVETVAAGLNPFDVAIDPNGAFLFASNRGSGDVSLFSIGDDGALSESATAGVGSEPTVVGLRTLFD